MILDQAFKYITELKRQNDELLLNGGNNEQGKDFKILTFCYFFNIQTFVSKAFFFYLKTLLRPCI